MEDQDKQEGSPTDNKPAEELWPELAKIKEDDGPITNKLDSVIVQKIKGDLSKNPALAETLLDFVAGRDFKSDRHAWELNTRSVAFNLGIPTAVIDVAIRRIAAKLQKKG